MSTATKEKWTGASAFMSAYNARVDKAKTRYPDWPEAFKRLSDKTFTDEITVFVFESVWGPDVLYYLATHRAELKRIRKLTPVHQEAALSKIEERFRKLKKRRASARRT